MGSEKPLMSQKEYLKKYLSKDKLKKKKKKSKISSSSHLKRSVIIDDDDDLGLKDVATVDDEEFNLDYLGDEAPQIVGIVDERPAELKAKEKYQNNLWRPIAEENVDNNFENLTKTDNVSNPVKKYDSDDSDLSLDRSRKNFQDENIRNRSEKRSSDKSHTVKKSDSDDSDLSLERPRKNVTNETMKNRSRKRSLDKSNNDSDLSPERVVRRKPSDSDSDMPPPRISKNKLKHSKKKEITSSNTDRSKRDKEYFKEDNFNRHNSKQKQRSNEYSDSEYPSKEHRYRKHDENRRNEDREKIRMREEGKRYNKDRHYEKRTYYDKNEHSDLSPERKNIKNRRNSDSDMSPPRPSRSKYKQSNENRGLVETRDRVNRGKDYYKDDKYSNRKTNYKSESSSSRKSQFKDGSPVNYRKGKNEDTDSDLSPERNRQSSKKKRTEEISPKDNAKEKMLDGKKSGLQDARHLKEELKRLKETEDQQFKTMDPKLLGANAAPVKRDRKTGLVRNIEKEVKEDKARAEKKAKTEEKYYKWGKGLKQVQDQEDRVADAIHEMSKPLARYRDDKDLDAFLKAQEREGDPMLEYIRSKQAESHNVIDLTVGSSKPKYNGSFMPNRFGIPPGYRWDGVDRSNGYEKKWFEQRNARKAVEEEAYKWSTSDM